jgi:MFS family permease
MIAGLYMVTLFVFAPIWGRLSDRIGRRVVLLAGLGGCVLAMLSFALSTTLWIAYAARAFGGAVVSAIVPVALAYVADASPIERRARHFAWLAAASTLALVLGPALGGWLASAALAGSPLSPGGMGFAWFVVVAAVLGSLVWVAVYFGLPETERGELRNSRTKIGQRESRLVLGLTLVGFFSLGNFETALTLRGQAVLGFTPGELAALFVICGLMMAALQIGAFARLVGSVGVRRALTGALLAMGLGIYFLAQAGTLAGVAVWVGLTAAGAAILMPLLGYAASLSAGAAQGRSLGRQTATGSLGQGLGSAAAGWLFGVAANIPFWATSALLVASAAVAFAVLRRTEALASPA